MERHAGSHYLCVGPVCAGYFKTIDRWAGRPTDEERDGGDAGGGSSGDAGKSPAGDGCGTLTAAVGARDGTSAGDAASARGKRFSMIVVSPARGAEEPAAAAAASSATDAASPHGDLTPPPVPVALPPPVAAVPASTLPVRRGRRYRFTLCGECVPAGQEGIPCCKPLNWTAWRSWNIHRKT
jgi:hypothetical protein